MEYQGKSSEGVGLGDSAASRPWPALKSPLHLNMTFEITGLPDASSERHLLEDQALATPTFSSMRRLQSATLCAQISGGGGAFC